MKNLLIILIIGAGITFAQNCYVEAVTGNVKVQIGSGEEWNEIKKDSKLPLHSTISTGKNSSVVLVKGQYKVHIKRISGSDNR